MLIIETALNLTSDKANTTVVELKNIKEFTNKNIEPKIKEAALKYNICQTLLSFDDQQNHIDEVYSGDNWDDRSSYLKDVYSLAIDAIKLQKPKLYAKYENDLIMYNSTELKHE